MEVVWWFGLESTKVGGGITHVESLDFQNRIGGRAGYIPARPMPTRDAQSASTKEIRRRRGLVRYSRQVALAGETADRKLYYIEWAEQSGRPGSGSEDALWANRS